MVLHFNACLSLFPISESICQHTFAKNVSTLFFNGKRLRGILIKDLVCWSLFGLN